MKVLILAGGYGTRLGEETNLKPKPMVEIGGMPILWHIMKIYAHYGFNDFVILGGYKYEMIRNWFVNYGLEHDGETIDFSQKQIVMRRNCREDWKVTVLDTGLDAMTGSRIAAARKYVGEEPFLLTYGDGVSDVDISALIRHHRESGKLATLTAVQPSGRWGALETAADGTVSVFEEKPQGDGGWINGGFFVCEPGVFDFIPAGTDVIWERAPLKGMVEKGVLGSYKHHGFWQPMDMLRDKNLLNGMWESGNAPWKVW